MCIIEIRPGRGGADAATFAGTLRDAIEAWARRCGWPVSARGSASSRTIIVTLAGVPAEAAA